MFGRARACSASIDRISPRQMARAANAEKMACSRLSRILIHLRTMMNFRRDANATGKSLLLYVSQRTWSDACAQTLGREDDFAGSAAREKKFRRLRIWLIFCGVCSCNSS